MPKNAVAGIARMIPTVGHIGTGSYARLYSGNSTMSTWAIGNIPEDTVTTSVDLYTYRDPYLCKPKIYLSRYQTIEMPWLFDYDEPWKAPVHYSLAPRKIIPKSSICKKCTLLFYKQPISKSGFKRGQRN